jgi:hypothetical protein
MSSAATTPETPLDVRLRPTAGVALLFFAALADLVLMLPRTILSLCCARRWRARTERLLFTPAPELRDAAQDPHPAR